MASIFSLTNVRDEPYLTRIFSYVLNLEPLLCKFVLDKCFGLRVNSIHEVKCEFALPNEKQIDLMVEAVDITGNTLKIGIENKITANFQIDQIDNYKKFMDKVFLIFKEVTDWGQFVKADGPPCSWPNLYTRLLEFLDTHKESIAPESMFVIKNFKLYLEEIGMGIGKVDWHLVEGLRSLWNLSLQVKEAVYAVAKEKGALVEKDNFEFYKGYGLGWRYWVINYRGLKATVYLGLEKGILDLCMHSHDKGDFEQQGFVTNRAKNPDKWGDWGVMWYLNDFDFVATHYFCLDTDGQISAIKEFIDAGLSALDKVTPASTDGTGAGSSSKENSGEPQGEDHKGVVGDSQNGQGV